MSAKQGGDTNKMRTSYLCFLGLFCCLCLIFSFIETLIPLDFIAPGVKLGLANTIALTLILFGDIKGAFLVNIARIILSALLFSTMTSLIFSLCGGVCSLIVTSLFSKSKNLSGIGLSVISALTHNIAQTVVAVIMFGTAIIYYIPMLLISATIGGVCVGAICNIICKKMETNKWFCSIIGSCK